MKAYNVRICFENPFMPETAYINICVNASNDEEAHMLATDELEHSLGQSLIVHETITL